MVAAFIPSQIAVALFPHAGTWTFLFGRISFQYNLGRIFSVQSLVPTCPTPFFLNVNFIKSLLNIPATIVTNLVALTLIPKATKEFIHTPHQLSPVPVKVKKQ
ncbi:MAG: hypothetical protein R2769_09035 [Saprospiraceae bacterium]